MQNSIPFSRPETPFCEIKHPDEMGIANDCIRLKSRLCIYHRKGAWGFFVLHYTLRNTLTSEFI